MVGQAVEEGPGEPFRAKDLGPLVEGQVGGSQYLKNLLWRPFAKS